MNIAILHYAVPPVVGGVESVIGHHARLMSASGHSVRILTGRGQINSSQVSTFIIPLLDSRNPDVLEVKRRLDIGQVPHLFSNLKDQLIVELKAHLEGIDLLIAHNVGSLNKNLPLTAALYDLCSQSDSVPLVLWHHDLAWTTPRYRSELHDGYPWSLLASNWQCVQRQVVVSEIRRRELAVLFNIPTEQITVIPNGVDLSSFLKMENQTSAIVEELSLLDSAPILLMPIRITRRKNIGLALNVLYHLKQHFPDAILLISGPLGPHNPANLGYFNELLSLRDELELKSSAHFMAEMSSEFLPDSIIADFYRIADALLLTSQEEGFGIPVLEAGISGLPVFCTDIPSLKELAGDYADYFAPDDSPENIAKIIYWRLKKDPVFRLRDKVRRKYTWEQINHNYLEPLWARVIDNRTR